MVEPVRVHVSDDHYGRPEQMASLGTSKTDRSGPGYIHGGASCHSSSVGTVIPSGEDVGQQSQISYLGHRLLFIRELEQIEIGVGDHDIVGLSTDPAPHVHVSVSATGATWVDVQTDSRLPLFTVSTSATRNIERSGCEVANIKELDIATLFNDLAGDLMTKNRSNRRRRAATHHVLITSADIGRNQLQDDRVFEFPAIVFHFWVVDIFDFDPACPYVCDTTIPCHKFAPV
jgi:hypothetical protein